MSQEGSRFEVYEGEDKKFYWRLVDGNNEPIAQHEGYDSEAGAIRAINNVKYETPRARIEVLRD